MSHVILAQWFGLISVILSLGILFNLDDAKIMASNMVHNESGYIMGGVLPIIFGSLVFIERPSFTFDWQIVLTLIGLFMLVIGIFRVIFVRAWKRVITKYLNVVPFLFSLFGLILGLLMLYVGFFASIVNQAIAGVPN